jgi:glycosyltransferase involved in cell wall biosynthesis
VLKSSGSGRYIYDVATRFAEDGARVTLVCHECEPELLDQNGVDVVRLARASGEYGLWRLGHYLELRSIRRQVVGGMMHKSFDAILGSDLLFLRALVDQAGRETRLVYTPLSMIAPLEIASYQLDRMRSWTGARLYHRLQRWALRRADRVVRFTPGALRALESYYSTDLTAKRVVAVYVSREFDGTSATAIGDGTSFERPRPRELLWIGRLVRSKRVDFLLRAASRLRSKDWVLRICSDGPERQSLEAQAVTLGLGAKVEFLGSVKDVAELYSRASIFLTASVLEQYSLTLMEAYAFGVPCIGIRPDWETVFNSNEDQIVDGVTGFVVDDETEMADRIDELLADEDKRQEMARRCLAMKHQYGFEEYYQLLKATLETVGESGCPSIGL